MEILQSIPPNELIHCETNGSYEKGEKATEHGTGIKFASTHCRVQRSILLFFPSEFQNPSCGSVRNTLN